MLYYDNRNDKIGPEVKSDEGKFFNCLGGIKLRKIFIYSILLNKPNPF